MCSGRTGQVRAVRLPPGPPLHFLERRREIDGVMKPPVPSRRDCRRFRNPVVDHPAPLEAEAAIDLAALGAVVLVPEFVFTYVFAIEARPQLCAERLAIPPGKELEKEVLHVRDPVNETKFGRF